MKKSVLALALGALFVSAGAMAADDDAITDGSVNFTGKVIAPACTLVAATKDSSVTLPDVSATKLQTSGQESGVKTDVPIELKDCDVTVTKNAAFTFSAAQDSNITTAFANQATTGQATNVALQMYMPNGTDKITPNTETAQDGIQLATGDQTLKFLVDYVATGKATAGTVNAVVNFHINYY
ncbi:fimbrial protein [Citrobacter portucalensis]|jgi:type 1 fimbria pilin|uniref:fimbrial protein n=1 Tax=Citrobacter TaxID=544 RepID=UPI0015E9425D|nr:fimbrial protein [Citrobacter sp. Cpo090]MDM2843627.1 fimbrial protein [Citrobacter sp. Cpo090]QMD48586.1 fimbrial protein [Citrobacter freundii]QMD58398.1 fimbrial protein [Citrobacter freundii]QMN54563.1 fimbrial protein [Citrobacter freundii]